MSRSFSLILAAVLFATVTLLLYGVSTWTTPAPQATFVSLKGERITTGELRGKVVLVNFWATDCATCIKEMPQVVATYNKYRERGLELIAVAMRHDSPTT